MWIRPRVSWKTERTSFSKTSSADPEAAGLFAASMRCLHVLGVGLRLAIREGKINPFLQTRVWKKRLPCNELGAWDYAMSVSRTLRKASAPPFANDAGQRARRQKKRQAKVAEESAPRENACVYGRFSASAPNPK